MPNLPKNNSLRLLIATLVLATSLTGSGLAANARPGALVFDVAAHEVVAGRPILMAKWEQALARHRRSLTQAEAACGADGRGRGCEVMEWRRFVSGLGGRPAAEQMAQVNRYLNGFRYITDARNWGQGDYWAAPQELFSRGGDCEDYVIAKYLSLRSLGVAAADMRILVLHDTSRNEAHAVLVVIGEDDAYVLDNLYRRVVTWRDVQATYRPLYSLNENSAWVHAVPQG